MATSDPALTLLGLGSAYCLAGCFMEHFVVFHSWVLIPAESPALLNGIQAQTGMRTLYIYVVPKALTTVLVAYLAWTTGEWWTTWCLAFLAVSWVSSFAVQIPLQLHIQRKGYRTAVESLVRTDWVRVMAMVGHCAILVGICFRVL